MRALNRQRRAESLRAAATGLFLARGLEQVTIDEIVAEAGMAKGSFYRYFEDKAALVESIFADVGGRVDDAFATCIGRIEQARDVEAIRRAYVGLAAALSEVVSEQPDQIRLYLQECRGPAIGSRVPVARLARRIRKSAVRLTEVAIERKLLRALDPRVIALIVIGAAERLVMAHLSGEEIGPAEGVPATLITLVLEGLRRAPGAKPASSP